MQEKKKKKIINYIVLSIVTLIFILAIIYLAPIMKDISTKEGQLAFKEKINNLGILGFLILFGLEVAQIFFVIIPGEPLEILAGMCYGSIGGTIFITASVFITTTIIFFIVKKYGRKFVEDTFSKEKVEKIENSKILKDPRKVETIMTILFFIPGTPKDLLVYIGGLLPIKPSRFILISTFARFPSVISSTIAGAKLAVGDIKTTIIVYAITFVITAIFLIIINIFDKNKETKEALNAIK
mgnify:FL=1